MRRKIKRGEGGDEGKESLTVRGVRIDGQAAKNKTPKGAVRKPRSLKLYAILK
jgi:hypothetical protein